jgi:D-arabinose 1-dehydrogenase-like Zn-dependent alcohol dehydrogenase
MDTRGDVAGRVAAVGQGVTAFKVGDEVFGSTREAGAYAEFVVVNATRLAHRPTLVTDGKIKPQIAAVETLWSPDSLWEKRETDTVGKIVFSIRS